MDERVPKSIEPILGRYLALLNQQLPNLLHSFYIVGSIALGEFNPYFSDIDFLVILNRAVVATDIDVLRSIHRSVEKDFPRWKLSGSYLQLCDVGKREGIAPHPHYHDGVLQIDSQHELNPVTWWELKQSAITVVGVAPESLSFAVDWNDVLAWTRINMNTYWAGWMSRPIRIMMLYSDWGIQWTVTGVLRQFYTFREKRITTKVRAAQYALGCLPKRWHLLIQEAINIREGKKKSLYWFRINRLMDAICFLNFIIQTCNADETLP